MTLKLSHAGLGDEGAAHIAQALQLNTSILSLDLSGNGAAADTGMVLSATLKVSVKRMLLMCMRLCVRQHNAHY